MGRPAILSRGAKGATIPAERKDRKKSAVAAIVAVAVVVVVIIVVIWRCAIAVREDHEQDLISNLQFQTVQSASAVEKALNDQIVLLSGISAEVSDNLKKGWTKEQLMSMFDSLGVSYNYKRIGYVDSSLNVYSSNHVIDTATFDTDLQKTFAGYNVITKPMVDSSDPAGEQVNVIRVPVRENGNEGGDVIGVLFAVIPHSTFGNMLNVGGFEGAGIACVLDETGEVVDATAESDLDGYGLSLLTYLQASGGSGDSAISVLESDLASGSSNTSYIEGQNSSLGGLYMYHVPLDVQNIASKWQLAVIVPASYLSSQVDSLLSSVYIMLFTVLVLVVVVGLLLALVLRYLRKGDLNRIRSYAYEDQLTGGNNFNFFQEAIRECHERGVIVSFDIDSFKDINSICGVKGGDEILVGVWRVLGGVLDEGDLAARVSGDHFVLYLRDPDFMIENTDAVEADLCKNLLPKRVQQAIVVRMDSVTDGLNKLSRDLETPMLKPRYGVYPWNPSKDLQECYNRAVTAASHVKSESDIRVAFFSSEDFERINEELAIIQSFDASLAAGEFVPFYQPKFTTEGKLVGAEALVRWRKPDGALMPPAKFIPLFERNGMIRQLDREMFIQVCRQQVAWSEEGLAIVPISVNLSRASLRFEGVRSEYVRIACEQGVAPSAVPIEITESAIAAEDKVSATIQSFRSSGFPVHMDDFGSGYSSLASLGSMNFDTIKIDKSLIDCIGGASGVHLLTHCVNLAHEMNLFVTAEGVERRDQLDFLRDLSCDSIQGSYFNYPLPSEEFENMLRKATEAQKANAN